MAFVVPTMGNVGVGGGGGLNVNNSASVAVGDILFMLMTGGQGGTDISVAAPVDWTLLGSGNNSKVYAKLADSGDVAAGTYPVTDTGAASFSTVNVVVVRVPGPYTTLPTYYHSQSFNGTGTITDSTGITPVEQQGTLLQLIADGNTTAVRTSSAYAVANTNPTWTEILDSGTTASGSFKPHLAIAYAGWSATSGTATGNVTFSISGTSAGILVTVHVPGIPFTFTAPSATATVGTPTFVLKILPSAASSAATIGAAVWSEITNVWNNAAKSISSWTNQSKS